MLVRVSTHFNCTEEKFWQLIIQPKSLQYVAAPIMRFKPTVEGALDKEWTAGQTYDTKLTFLNFLPLGHHHINIIRIDKQANTIVSQEKGTLAPVWNHTMQFSQVESDTLLYTDEIEIKAGILTLAIWAFAQFYYHYRQQRWKKLLKES